MSDRFDSFVKTGGDGAFYLVCLVIAILMFPIFVLLWPIGKVGQFIFKEGQEDGRSKTTTMRGP